MKLKDAEQKKSSIELQPSLERWADRIARLGLSMPAVMLLESCRPLNLVGSSALHFLSPCFDGLGLFPSHAQLAHFLEDRQSIDHMIRLLEQAEAASEEEHTS